MIAVLMVMVVVGGVMVALVGVVRMSMVKWCNGNSSEDSNGHNP